MSFEVVHWLHARSSSAGSSWHPVHKIRFSHGINSSKPRAKKNESRKLIKPVPAVINAGPNTFQKILVDVGTSSDIHDKRCSTTSSTATVTGTCNKKAAYEFRGVSILDFAGWL